MAKRPPGPLAWPDEMSLYAQQVGSIASQLAGEIERAELTTTQLRESCAPLESALNDWLNHFSALWLGIDAHLEAGDLTYETELPADLREILDGLRDEIPELQAALDAIKGLPVLEPEEVPLPVPAVSEDGIPELQDEMSRIIQAIKGDSPDVPKWAEVLSIAMPMFGVADAIKGEEWGTTAQQAALGAAVGGLSAITGLFGATTFAAFMLEEGCQAVGMSAWIAYNAKEYETAWQMMQQQDELIREAKNVLELWRPLMPLTYPGFKRFFDASGQANGAWFVILHAAMEKAGLVPPPTLAVSSKPSGARLYIDGEETDTLTPETFKTLEPGPHTITAVLAPTATIGERGASEDVVLEAGKKLEISLVLMALEEGAPPEVLPTAPATLRILSSPSDAQIWLDGIDTGVLTPETFTDAPLGEHTIRVVVPESRMWPERSAEITLTLEAGEKREIMLSPSVP